MAGVPTRVIEEMAGYASVTTTERYLHLAPGSTQEAVRKLEQLSSGFGRILVASAGARHASRGFTGREQVTLVKFGRCWVCSDAHVGPGGT